MRRLTILAVLALASALVACGGSDSATSGSAATTGKAARGPNERAAGISTEGHVASLEADPHGKLAYTTNEASVKAGTVTVYLWNPQSTPHNVALEDSQGKYIARTETVHNTGTNITVHNMKPGTYTFYCAVPGHREAGMEGTLIVE